MAKLATISEITDFKGKNVLVRVDLNPIVGGRIQERFRLEAHKKTIEYLREKGAVTVLASHITTEAEPIHFTEQTLSQLSETLGVQVRLISNVASIAAMLIGAQSGDIFLLDNLRQWPGEEENDDAFASRLAKGFDFYVNDAFSVCHRNHTSVVAITKHISAYAGFLIEKEIQRLTELLDEPAQGKILLLGGAKISTKAPVIKNFLERAEWILVGGAIANEIFETRGIKIGTSTTEKSGLELGFPLDHPKLILPEDFVVSADRSGAALPGIVPVGDIKPSENILDIGPKTIRRFGDTIKTARMILWNGPLGLAEVDVFSRGTKFIAEMIIHSKAEKTIGGGDTIAFLEKENMLDKFDFVSTGGGAMLAFLAGERLPGLEALGHYK